jgi:hypothetical protein
MDGAQRLLAARTPPGQPVWRPALLELAPEFHPTESTVLVSLPRLVHLQGQERADHGLSHEIPLYQRT